MEAYAILTPYTSDGSSGWKIAFWKLKFQEPDYYEMTRGFHATREEAIESIRYLFRTFTNTTMDDACECGGRAVGFKPFDAGHSHWCPVSSTR